MENETAKVLGADLFGASESSTIKYNDKASFKTICQQLDIPVVKGSSFEIYPDNNENCLQFEKIINKYLSKTKIVIIRGTLGDAGMSLYKTRGNDIAKLYRQIANSGERVVIIEPFLNVSSSPNDQWIIDRNGNINHLGMRQQICERGMVHVGTLKGEKMPQDVLNYISKISMTIVTHMAESGYQGVVGIDYIVTDKGIYPIENNARFNGSSYVNMIIENIEGKLNIPIPYWKFIKIKTSACSFLELTKRMESILYDDNQLNCVFPYNCDALPMSGDFAVVILAGNMAQIINLEKSLKEIGIKR
jgi:biotin carboxylase